MDLQTLKNQTHAVCVCVCERWLCERSSFCNQKLKAWKVLENNLSFISSPSKKRCVWCSACYFYALRVSAERHAGLFVGSEIVRLDTIQYLALELRRPFTVVIKGDWTCVEIFSSLIRGLSSVLKPARLKHNSLHRWRGRPQNLTDIFLLCYFP